MPKKHEKQNRELQVRRNLKKESTCLNGRSKNWMYYHNKLRIERDPGMNLSFHCWLRRIEMTILLE
ncbi:hypothetical protein Bca52824_081339 [Brassica carinata]|uniref:Uncharacterized protein n=3 Tax=Brassica TaxID=3705 RepID=A0A0D3CS33_BRAOL|nr:hypothetical protein Bca52824_081339 [Brassica carinata]VDD60954.1 unnamed protein product [Brassica oleracea]